MGAGERSSRRISPQKGGYQGQLLSDSAKQRPSRLRAQLMLSPERHVELGREIVRAKISKQRALLQRYLREGNRQDLVPKIELIKELGSRVRECGTRDELMGIEGASARTYFEAFPVILPSTITSLVGIAAHQRMSWTLHCPTCTRCSSGSV